MINERDILNASILIVDDQRPAVSYLNVSQFFCNIHNNSNFRI